MNQPDITVVLPMHIGQMLSSLLEKRIQDEQETAEDYKRYADNYKSYVKDYKDRITPEIAESYSILSVQNYSHFMKSCKILKKLSEAQRIIKRSLGNPEVEQEYFVNPEIFRLMNLFENYSMFPRSAI